ncbi:integrase [Labrys okinawensis]|uniref:Integrase n=2 Tax=Labrys okinawensis TaxID=346911 RepID=A0A2S9QC70_9HYPH|nr:integrase [Labrys okinawensis]
MARHKLKDLGIRALTEPGIYGDGDGLYLRVQTGGRRSWVFIWKRFGIRREIGLGPYGSGTGAVSLAAARAKAEEAREIVGRGGDPKIEMAERQAAKRVATFGQITEEYIETMKPKWRGDKTVAAWERFSKTYTDKIRKVPIDKVSTEDVLSVLRPFWHDKPETATKVRERIKLVLDHGKARGLRQGDNPAEWRGHLDQILPPPKKLAKGHHASLPYTDAPAFVKKIRRASGVAARALEFIILTGSRSLEVRGAEWQEIDMAKAVWTVPAARMKTGKEHRVPLAARAIEILTEMQESRRGNLVFEGRVDASPVSDVALAKCMKTYGAGDFTIHGFRSTFREWTADETQHQREVAEAALSHAVGDQVERAYRRGDALAKRRRLMDDWAAYLGGADGTAGI